MSLTPASEQAAPRETPRAEAPGPVTRSAQAALFKGDETRAGMNSGAGEGPPEGAVFVSVAPMRGIEGAARAGPTGRGNSRRLTPELTYFVPPGVEPVAGALVSVPLRGTSAVPAIITSVADQPPGDVPATKLRPVLNASAAAEPVLTPDLLELARWIDDAYVCPLGMVLAAMLPAGVKREVGKATRTVLDLPTPDDAEDADQHGDPKPNDADHQNIAPPKLPPAAGSAWESLQTRLRAHEPHLLPAEPKTLARTLGLASAGPLNRLVREGLLVKRTERFVRTRSEVARRLAESAQPDARPELNDDQAAAVAGMTHGLDRIEPGRPEVHVLLGVTGSGKTEVYLRTIEHALELGLGAVVLVPEIALTPQTSQRFLARFGPGSVAVLHSALPASERHAQWRRAADAEARVVVGPRSAVFTPVPNLGVIVIDEEHDTSYKQDQLPRYHARAAAIRRAHIEGAAVVLGSATPSIETYARALRSEQDRAAERTGPGPRWFLHRLPSRVCGRPLPPVEIIDLAREHREPLPGASGTREPSPIGDTLMSALSQTLEARSQALLLLNRRGHSTHLGCSSRACGHVVMCDHCDSGLVLHRGADLPRGELLRCHHCGGMTLPPAQCPQCERPIVRLGLGVQRVEELLAQRFGLVSGETLLRLDSDSMRSARDYFDALDRFARGEARVLVGTQMVAKGLDNPRVRLVGVVSADVGLHQPDFRAMERTFQLVAQVAGRTGRGEAPGRVIVQTMNPSAEAIVLAARHDYEAFAKRELGVRARALRPPVRRLCRIVCRHLDDAKAKASAEDAAETLRDVRTELSIADSPDHGPRHAEVTGPSPCVIQRIADHWRHEVLIAAGSAVVLRDLLRGARVRGLHADAGVAIDVDPVSML